jgi:NAD(P)-dependent dehydrogenase (short-subunit alcohol dehydrogenase family)
MDATVVVTGGTRGIGRATAEALAEAGARVVVSARDADAVAETVEALPGESTGLRADVRDEFDVERLMETAARFGPGGVDHVVAAAAVAHGRPGATPLPAESYAAFDDTVRTNARGVLAAVREALPHMPADGRAVVPTGSVAREATEGGGAYAVSKAAAEAVVRGLAADCAQVVGCVDPGLVATDLTGGEGRPPEDAAEQMVWALRGASADELDGAVLDRDAWDAATE